MGRTAYTEPQCLYKGALYLYLYFVGSCAVCYVTSVCFMIISVVSALCLVQHVIVTVGRKLDVWGSISV